MGEAGVGPPDEAHARVGLVVVGAALGHDGHGLAAQCRRPALHDAVAGEVRVVGDHPWQDPAGADRGHGRQRRQREALVLHRDAGAVEQGEGLTSGHRAAVRVAEDLESDVGVVGTGRGCRPGVVLAPAHLDDERYVRHCLDFIRRHKVNVFLPGTKLRPIIKARHQFEALGVRLIAAADADTLHTLESKSRFYRAVPAEPFQGVAELGIAQHLALPQDAASGRPQRGALGRAGQQLCEDLRDVGLLGVELDSLPREARRGRSQLAQRDRPPALHRLAH